MLRDVELFLSVAPLLPISPVLGQRMTSHFFAGNVPALFSVRYYLVIS